MPDRFATMLTCIDGRIQRPLDEWVRAYIDVEYVDTITEPGPTRVLAESGESGERHLAALLDKIAVSRQAHGSVTLVLAAHSDCAGNPIPDEEQRGQLRDAVSQLARRLPGIRILAVHAGQCGERCWSPELVAEAPAGRAAEPVS